MVAALRSSPTGHWERSSQGYETFIPAPLPRRLELNAELVVLLDRASRAVSLLAGIGETLPDPYLLIRPFMRREAVLSSRIEGTQASLSDLLMYEASEERRDPADAREVANYVRALEHGLARLKELPLSVRLMNEMHAHLLAGVRGEDKMPGQLRTRQVWIGESGTRLEEARFVPPPASALPDLLSDLERFLNENVQMPPLVQAAMMHYQFESIHPYTDGNGRIGRLLIVLFLCAKDVLPTPLLYLSAYFERLRDDYYDGLLKVSETGEWDAWLRFFLRGVELQARDAAARSRRMRRLQDDYRARLQGVRSGNAGRLLDDVFVSPFTTAPRAVRVLGITLAAARKLLEKFVALGILDEDRSTRPRFYVARELLLEIERPMLDEHGEQLPLLS
ncbi:MAG: Fic family protein [Dehalococcoidia bacterium]